MIARGRGPVPSGMTQAISTNLEADERLLERWRGGDKAAFDTLYRRYHGTVLQQLQRYMGREDAEQVLQEVFIRVMKLKWKQQGKPFAHWLSRVTRHAAISWCRSETTRKAAAMAKPESSTEQDPTQRLMVDQAFANLAEDERAYLFLHHVYGWTLREIALEHGVGTTTVHDRLQSGRRKAARRLDVVAQSPVRVRSRRKPTGSRSRCGPWSPEWVHPDLSSKRHVRPGGAR